MTIAHGFPDPVRDQQRAFRAVMDALSRPAAPIPYASPIGQAGPMHANAFAIGLTLLDFEVNYHLAPSLVGAEQHLTFQTGSRRVENTREAQFAFIDLRHDRLELDVYAQGVSDYPDRSTTIIALSTEGEQGETLVCRGPGIAASKTLHVPGLPTDFAAQWQINAARAPLGVDVLFVTADAIVGLPRSTRIFGEAR